MKKYFLQILILLFVSGNLFSQQKNYELVDVEFLGNENISSAELSTIIISQESPGWISQFINSFSSFGDEARYFDSTLIQSDMNALTNFYFDNGFFEVHVDYKYSIDTLDRSAKLLYKIKEGDVSRFNKIAIEGIDNIHPDFLKAIRDFSIVEKNEVFKKKIIDQLRVEILTYLKNKGLMLASSDVPEVEIDTVLNVVDVRLFIDPGARYKISEIRVEKTGSGKDLVEDQLLSEIVNFKPGEFYNYNRMQLAQTRLYKTNLFNSALVSGIIADTSGITVPLLISADVGLLNEFSPEILINNENDVFNLGLGLGFTRKNFLGNARKFTISTSAASQNLLEFLTNPSLSNNTIDGYADLRVLLNQPFIFGSPIYTQLESSVTLQKRQDTYNATIIGVKLSFNFELPQKVYVSSLTTYFNYEHSKFLYQPNYLAGYSSSAQIDSLSLSDVKRNNSIIGVELGVLKTDNFVFPVSGYTITMNLENANLLPYIFGQLFNYKITEPQYYKTLLVNTAFLPLSPVNTATMGFKLSLGQIHAYTGDKFSIPFNQRFTSGGSNSVRGWGARELVANKKKFDIDFNTLTPEALDALLVRNITLGGYFLLEGSLEYRQKFLNNFGAAFFADFGNSFYGYEDFKFKNLGLALGFGIRYYSEIVPIRLDFGFKFYDPEKPQSFFTKHIYQDTFQFHLGIGEAF